jgi:hypothetical protein
LTFYSLLQDLVSALRFLSHAVAASEALQESSGTSIMRHRSYKSQVKAFREEWLRSFHPRIFGKTVFKPEDYERMPVFDYRDEPEAACVTRAGAGAAAMASMAALLFRWAERRLQSAQ